MLAIVALPFHATFVCRMSSRARPSCLLMPRHDTPSLKRPRVFCRPPLTPRFRLPLFFRAYRKIQMATRDTPRRRETCRRDAAAVPRTYVYKTPITADETVMPRAHCRVVTIRRDTSSSDFATRRAAVSADAELFARRYAPVRRLTRTVCAVVRRRARLRCRAVLQRAFCALLSRCAFAANYADKRQTRRANMHAIPRHERPLLVTAAKIESRCFRRAKLCTADGKRRAARWRCCCHVAKFCHATPHTRQISRCLIYTTMALAATPAAIPAPLMT